jgi:hypothetical protein
MDGKRQDHSTRRIEELVFALEALPDPAAAASARELVQLVLELHGTALSRIMETISTDAAGARLAAALVEDECVNGVLLLHDLHPSDFEARVHRALAQLHPHLGVRGVTVQSVEIQRDAVRIQLTLSDAGRYRSGDADTTRREIEQAVLDAAPDASVIDIMGLPENTAFIPVSSIAVRRKAEDTAGAPP